MNYVFTPAFCKSALLEQSINHIKKTNPKSQSFEYKHVIIDNHYPVNKTYNRSEIKSMAIGNGCVYIDSTRDLGLHNGINNAMRYLDVNLNRDTCLICDPDDRPSPEAFHDQFFLIQNNPDIAVCALNFSIIKQRVKESPHDYEEKKIMGHDVYVHHHVEMWNVSAYNSELIKSMGGFKEPNAYYGGLESMLYPHYKRRNQVLVYLKNHTSEYTPVNREDSNLFDASYRDWKWAHAHKGYMGSYEEYLLTLLTS